MARVQAAEVVKGREAEPGTWHGYGTTTLWCSAERSAQDAVHDSQEEQTYMGAAGIVEGREAHNGALRLARVWHECTPVCDEPQRGCASQENAAAHR